MRNAGTGIAMTKHALVTDAMALTLIISAVATGLGHIEAAPPSTEQLPLTSGVPLPIRETRDQALRLYHAARASEWTVAARVLPRLTGWVTNARNETVGDSADVDSLEALSRALSASVRAHQRSATMSKANEITLIAANLSDPYAPLTPTDLDRLAYDGRAVQIASDEANVQELRHRVGELERTWDRVRRKAIARDPEGATYFESSLKQLEQARSRGQFRRAAHHELRAVDALQRSFEEH